MSQSTAIARAKIFLVHPALAELRLLDDILSEPGYDLDSISKADQAVIAIQESVPDLLLLSVAVDSHNLQLFQVLAQTKGFQIILISDSYADLNQVKALAMEAVDYLVKPFVAQAVLWRVERALQGSHLKRLEPSQNEHQLIAERLRHSEIENRAFLEAISDLVLIIDAEINSIRVAPTNFSHLYPGDVDVVSQTVEQFFGEAAAHFRTPIQQALATGQLIRFEYSLTVGDRTCWFAANIAPTSDNSVAWVARDISDRARAEAALKEAKAIADGANRAKTQFLTNMSHELRTPLNAILGFTQVLQKDLQRNQHSSRQQQWSHLEIIRSSGEHLLALINDILDLSKIEAGRMSLYQTSFDLDELLNSLEEMLRIKALEKGLDLSFERTAAVPQSVQTDEGKLRQILINLLGNGIKFTETGRVTLRVDVSNQEVTQPNQQYLCFEVEDTGAGIAPEEIHKLFEPFVQTETGQKSHSGSGLGLSISRKFVQMMGGDISVSSTLGSGTVFRFAIPVTLVAPSSLPPSQPQVIGLVPNQSNYRILVVEDHPESRQLLVKLLEPLGFEVREAQNGAEAIALWQSWQPHLIWMDMRMPIMDGYEATRRIKSALTDTIVIALTASALEQDKASILGSGCDDFVRKPYQEALILEKIAQHLGITYLYDQPVDKIVETADVQPKAEGTKPANYTLEQLQLEIEKMPAEWLEQLHQAAVLADDEQMLELIQSMVEIDVAVVNALTDLINNFRSDQIMYLTRNFAESK